MEDEMEQADYETHYDTSRYTAAEDGKRDSLRMDHVMEHQEKVDARLQCLSWRFTKILVLAAKKTRDDEGKYKAE